MPVAALSAMLAARDADVPVSFCGKRLEIVKHQFNNSLLKLTAGLKLSYCDFDAEKRVPS